MSRLPDFTGVEGRAWRIQILPEDRKEPDQEASLAAWHLHCPRAHPFWSWYMVTLVHLRELPSGRPVKKHYPEAAYEVIVMSLNPDFPPPEPGIIGEIHYLEPFDQVLQFSGERVGGMTDAHAIRVIELYIWACVNGHISPDQDYRQAWKAMMPGTIEHVVTGGHA